MSAPRCGSRCRGGPRYIEEGSGSVLGTPVLAALLALARPEGLMFATALSGAMWWTVLVPVHRRQCPLAGLTWSLLPLLAGLGQLLFYRWATGTMVPNGVRSKSFLYDRPVLYLGEFIDRTVGNFGGFLELFGGFSTHDFAFPGAVFFVVLGVFWLGTERPAWRPLVIAMTTGLVAVLISVSTLDTAHAQNVRYVQPFMPVFILLTMAGVHGYRADWSRAGAGEQATTPGTVRDYLNVGDLASEEAHAYDPQLAQVGMQPMSVLRGVSLPDGRLVLAQGVPVGRWHRSRGGPIWTESSFTVPGPLVTGSTVALELAAPRGLWSPYPDYLSFGYWFSQ